MNIEVRLFASLREGRGKKLIMNLNEGSTPQDIINQLKINEKDVAILLINGKDGELDRKLADGDIISIFPPVGGG